MWDLGRRTGAAGLHRNHYTTYISSIQLHNLLLTEHSASVLKYSFKIHVEQDNNLNAGLRVPDAWTGAPEKGQKALREPSSHSFFAETSATLAIHWILWNTGKCCCSLDGQLCQGAAMQAEGGHNSQRKEHMAVLCGEHVHFNYGRTMLLHTTHSLGLWLSGTVCPYTCNMACFFFIIIFLTQLYNEQFNSFLSRFWVALAHCFYGSFL